MAGFDAPSMNWNASSLPAEFASFRQYCDLVLDGPYTSKSEKEKASYLLLWIGRQGIDIYKSWTFTDEADKYKLNELYARFEQHLQPKVNSWLARFQLQQCHQQPTESADDFICRCRNVASKCKFSDAAETDTRLMEQLIIGTRYKAVQEKLLEKGDRLSSLDEAMDIARTHEATVTQMAELSGAVGGHTHAQSDVDVIKSGHYKKPSQSTRTKTSVLQSSSPSFAKKCQYCGKECHDRSVCPAKAATCHFCRKVGHFQHVCRQKQKSASQQPMVSPSSHPPHSVDSLTTAQLPDIFLGTVDASDADPWCVCVSVNGVGIDMKLETGADVTVIPSHVFSLLAKPPLSPTTRVLYGANSSKLAVEGVFEADMDANGVSVHQDVYVVADLKQPLLGRPAIKALGLLSLSPIADRVSAVSTATGGTCDQSSAAKQFPSLFQPLGKFSGEPYCIRLAADVKPVALSSPRRVPIPLYQKVEDELGRMVTQGIITPVDQPTDWCSGLVVVTKRSGAVRLCVDYTELNKYVRTEQHVLPCVDHTLGQLAGAKFFTKLDANSGFYQVPLSEDSQRLTTFITPFGRYMFTRLPFGICSAPEHFQKRMSRILQGLTGVVCQMDDTLIFGNTEQEHDDNLTAVLQRLSDNGVTLNPDKCLFKATTVKFLGHVLDQSGIHPDPDKVQGIHDFPPCRDVSEVRTFMGMVNQLGKFSPRIASVSQPIRELLKKDVAWCWDHAQQSAFEELKRILSSAPVLAFYSPSYPTIVSADASSYGIGAVISQQQPSGEWQPVSFQSRSLTPTERRYAQIEKEALALTWACERFSDYLIGKHFVIETDHKPLVPLLSTTPLNSVPPRVLRFRLRLLRYDFSIVHIPGKDHIIADALSRSPSSCVLSMDEVTLLDEAEYYVNETLAYLPASDARLEEIRKHQAADPTCQALFQYVRSSWPDQRLLPDSLKIYFSKRAFITVADGLLLHGSRLVIPQSLRHQVLEQLHTGHLGITKCRDRAKQSVWWPGLSTQLADFVSKCQICVRDKGTSTEPLISTDVPELPWQRVAADFMKFNGSQYLVLVDYYSRFVELARMSSTTATSVILQFKSIFARHGFPDALVTDNGPPFNSSDFAAWLDSHGVHHYTSSPGHPQGNGLAERTVQSLKSFLRKNDDPYIGLLSYRSAPLECGYSPAELLMGRRLRTDVPMAVDQRRPYLVDVEAFRSHQQQIKERQESNYNSRHRAQEAPPLDRGDDVYLSDRHECGSVAKKLSTRSYTVSTESGSFRRNRKDIVRDPDSHSETVADPVEECPPSPAPCPVEQSSPNVLLSQSVPVPASPQGGESLPIPGTSNTPDVRSSRTTKMPSKYNDCHLPLRLRMFDSAK